MTPSDRPPAAQAVLEVSGALVEIAVRSVMRAPTEVTVASHRVLALVAQHGPSSVGELAELLGIDQSTVSRHCSRLEGLGLLARRRDERDGRVVRVEATSRGRGQVAAVSAYRLREIQMLLDALPADAREDVERGFVALSRATTVARERRAQAF